MFKKEVLNDEQRFREYYQWLDSLVVGSEVAYGFLWMGCGSYGAYEIRKHGISKIQKIKNSGRFQLENGLTFNPGGLRYIGTNPVKLMPTETLEELLKREPIVKRRLKIVHKIIKMVGDDSFPYIYSPDMKMELLELVQSLDEYDTSDHAYT